MKGLRLNGLLSIMLLGLLATGASYGQSSQSLPDAPQPQKTAPPPEPPPTESSSRNTSPVPPVQPRVDEHSQPDPANAPLPNTDQPAIGSPQAVRNPSTPDTKRLYTMVSNVNFIEIPVTVKDHGGRMVEGLLPKDFTVYEDGTRQKLAYFTSDPLAISAAAVDPRSDDPAHRSRAPTGFMSSRPA